MISIVYSSTEILSLLLFFLNMKILLLGSGGREHALAWKISQSDFCESLFVAPGNPGMTPFAENIELDILNFKSIADFVLSKNIEMILVGPEEPLVLGIYDYFSQNENLNHIHIIGPSQLGAQLEGSKSFAKQFMQRWNIPTASYREFHQENYEEGIAYLQQHPLPIVLKADGLAAGKGVVICETHDDALQVFEEMILKNKFGKASTRVVVEQFLKGIESSCFVLTDGEHWCLLPDAKDYKRIGEGDMGLNTGGMGAISPVPFIDDSYQKKIIEKIVEPSIRGIREEGIVYKGFLFIGLIHVDGEPYVIEYNCRMGDPETEVVMLRIENDLVPLLISLKENKLHEHHCLFTKQSAAAVILVSGGYPESYEKGKVIDRMDDVQGSIIFHAGTKLVGNQLETNGGRVLAVSSIANSLKEALALSKKNAELIQFEGKYYRKDIGWEFE